MLRDSKLDLRASIRILIELKFGGKFWGETHGCNISARRCCRRNHLRRRSICPGRRSFRSRIGTRMACKWNANKMYIILSNMDTILNPFFLTAAKVKKISISNANKFVAGDFSISWKIQNSSFLCIYKTELRWKGKACSSRPCFKVPIESQSFSPLP